MWKSGGPPLPGNDSVAGRLYGVTGRIRLNDNNRKLTEVATLVVITTSRGRPRPGTRGIWLDVSVNPSPRGKRFIDGNRLYATSG